MEQVKVAIDTKDRVAAHGCEHDAFAHHVRAAPANEAVAELTDVRDEFEAHMPNHYHLQVALDTKDRLATHGMRLPEEETVWREELDEAVQNLA